MLPAGRSRGVPGRLSAARFIPSPAVRMPMMQQVRPMHVAVETEKGKAWVESAALWNLKASACCTVLSCAVLHESVLHGVKPWCRTWKDKRCSWFSNTEAPAALALLLNCSCTLLLLYPGLTAVLHSCSNLAVLYCTVLPWYCTLGCTAGQRTQRIAALILSFKGPDIPE